MNRILLVDDHAMFREAVSRILSTQPDFDVTHCGTATETLHALATSSFDLIVMDFDLGEEVATKLIPQIKQAGFAGKIVILSASVSEHAAWQLAEAGVHGIVLKRHSSSVLVEKLRAALRGETCSDPIYEQAMKHGADAQSSAPWPDLTDRERDTLRLLVRGAGNKELASAFKISEHAVKATMQRLFNKTGARTRSELVRVALQNYSHEL